MSHDCDRSISRVRLDRSQVWLQLFGLAQGSRVKHRARQHSGESVRTLITHAGNHTDQSGQSVVQESSGSKSHFDLFSGEDNSEWGIRFEIRLRTEFTRCSLDGHLTVIRWLSLKSVLKDNGQLSLTTEPLFCLCTGVLSERVLKVHLMQHHIRIRRMFVNRSHCNAFPAIPYHAPC